MHFRRSRTILVTAVSVFALSILLTIGFRNKPQAVEPSLRKASVLSILQPYESQLKASGIPVYLPTWLPPARPPKPHQQLHVWLQVSHNRYEIALTDYQVPRGSTPCNQCMLLDVYGVRTDCQHCLNSVEVSPEIRPVLLHPGKDFTRGV